MMSILASTLFSAFDLFCLCFLSPRPPPPWKAALLRTSQGSADVAVAVVDPDWSS